MSFLIGLLYVVEVIVCILLALVVMLQKPKEGGLGGAIGGGMSEAVFGAGITNLTDGVTHDLLIINICCRSNLTADNNKTGAGSCLTGNTAHGILRNDCVQNRI